MGDPPPGVGGSQTKQTFAAPFVIWLVPRRSLSGQIDAQFLSGVITHPPSLEHPFCYSQKDSSPFDSVEWQQQYGKI